MLVFINRATDISWEASGKNKGQFFFLYYIFVLPCNLKMQRFVGKVICTLNVEALMNCKMDYTKMVYMLLMHNKT